jgi:prevent-host-death family protein
MKRNAKEVGLFDAKTHLSALVNRVAHGEEITITKHGVPVTRLIPPSDRARGDPKEAAAKIRGLRRGIVL